MPERRLAADPSDPAHPSDPADPTDPADQPDRNRNAWGRPEQGRRRDHTGRPLPADAPTPPRGYAQEHEVATVQEALDLAVDCWNRGRYFEAHELLEHVWHHAPEDERSFWKGVIQVAVTHVMGQRDRAKGVELTVAKARVKLHGWPETFHGIDVPGLVAQLDEALRQARAGEQVAEPAFPALHGGPWFREDGEDAELTREPPWLVASRELANRDVPT